MKVLRVAHHAVVSAWRERERQLIEQGLDVRLLSAAAWDEGGARVSLRRGSDTFVSGARTLGSHPNVFAYDPRPLWHLLGQDQDLIDLHEEPCSLAVAEVLLIRWLRRCTTPYVLYSAQNIEKRYPVPFRCFERIALRGAVGAYVCNKEAGEILKRKGLRGPATLIPLGVDVETFEPRPRAAPGSDEVVVGYVGRLAPHKGVSVLIEAAQLRPDWRLEITGGGPQYAELEALVTRSGLGARVRFLGHASGSALAERYRSLDVLAVPSLPTPGWLEQFCRVAVEAMAAGVPVVASDSGAIPDVVSDSGLLVPPADARRLAEAVDAALMPETWTALRKRGLEHSRDFGWRVVAEEQRRFYVTVLGGSDPATDPEVVVIAYGSPDLLGQCLASLGGSFPVTVVDNSSLPETAEVAERHGAHYVDAGANLGFAAGVNLGLRSLRERGLGDRDVLLLNPDVVISAVDARKVHRAAHVSSRTACAGASQVDPATGASSRVQWAFPSPAGAWIEALGFGFLRRHRDFVIGSVLLLRADAIAEVGDFDEDFFLYSEEADWQRRARDRGWRVSVVGTHSEHVGGGTGGSSERRHAHFNAGLERFVRKHHGRLGWAVFRSGVIVGSGIRAVVLSGERAEEARGRVRTYLTGPVRVEAALP